MPRPMAVPTRRYGARQLRRWLVEAWNSGLLLWLFLLAAQVGFTLHLLS